MSFLKHGKLKPHMKQRHQNLTAFNVNVVHGKWLSLIKQARQEETLSAQS